MLLTMHWLIYCIATAVLIVVFFKGVGNTASLYGLVGLNTRARAIFAVALCSMAGVPPFIGF